ncbi:MAG: NAAT family transporter [Verrucomicrobia bacterium]|nr:NAAT family transporter [Verrucomicrobiota bacterium]
MDIAATAFTLFLVLDPFGNMAMFHTVLSRLPEHRRRKVLLRELLISLFVLLFFLLAGSWILDALGIRPQSLSIAGGIILFLIALGMVFPSKSILHEVEDEEPFIVPLTVPMIAGPSAIALLLLIASKHPGQTFAPASALLIAWAASSIVLLLTPWLLGRLGAKGTRALERLMGLLLILIAVQMFLDGLPFDLVAPPVQDHVR